MSPTPDDGADDRWLDVLSGRRPAAADQPEELQAQAVRESLKRRRERLDAQVPEADAALYQQMRFRLRREGLDRPPSAWRRPALWGMAASLMLGLAVVVRLVQPDDAADQPDTLRGDGSATVLIVPDLQGRLAELQQGLQAAGAQPQVLRLPDGRIRLQVPATVPVLDWLATQRIEPVVQDGMVTLILSPSARP